VKDSKKKAGDRPGGADIASEVLESINDKLGGKDVAQMLGSEGLAIKIRGVISTGCATIDAASGRGGVPLGRLIILHGAEASGKTTLALQIVAQAQLQGGVAVYMDTEYKLDPDYAAALGVNTKRMINVQPSYLEQAFAVCEGAIERAAKHRESTGLSTPILIVLDSMNSTISKSQFEGEWDDQHYAPQARVFSALLPKLMPKVSRENVCLLWVSQVRKKMGVMYGDDEEIAGGNAPRFYASQVLKVRRIGTVKKGEEKVKVANKITVEFVKNQVAPPFKKAECELEYGKGFNQPLAILTQAEKWGIVERDGNTYRYEGKKIGGSIAYAVAKLDDDDELREKILCAIRDEGKWKW